MEIGRFILIERALRSENDKIVLILTRNSGYRKKPTSCVPRPIWYRVAYKKYPNLVSVDIQRNYIYNRQMNLIEKLRGGKIFVLRPRSPRYHG